MNEDIPLSIRIAERLAASLDRRTTEIPPIHDAVDLEAVERLVDYSTGDDLVVAFEYEGLAVRVHGDGAVEVIEGALAD